MIDRRLVLAGCCAAAFAPKAFAHRAARTETELRIEADGTVGVIHVYHLQDAQDALYKAGLIDRPDLTPLRARARLALYTRRHFSLSEGGEPVDLDVIGAEIEGDNVYVYQEGRLTGDGALVVMANMLRELMHDQTNSVNVVRNGRTQTLDFRGEDGPKPVA
ncbi:MAG: DUF6702 family protein [Pseudomonadota bacterium]